MRRNIKELSDVMAMFSILLGVWVIKVFLKSNVRLVYATVYKFHLKEKLNSS